MNSRTFSIRIRSISPFSVVVARTPLVTDRLAAAGPREMGAFRTGQQEIQPAAFDDRGRIGSVEVDAEMPGKRVVARVRRNGCVPMINGDKVELCAHLAHSAQTAGGRAASATEQVGYAEAAPHDGVAARTACVSWHEAPVRAASGTAARPLPARRRRLPGDWDGSRICPTLGPWADRVVSACRPS